MENKQTAVKWVFNKLRRLNVIDETKYEIFCQLELEAEVMEKEQLINAVEWNYKSNMGEVYYNARYGK